MKLIPTLLPIVTKLTDRPERDLISPARKRILESISEFVDRNVTLDRPTRLNFICTHNSRRSQIAQIWAQAASWYYGIPGVLCFSGGTEATAFNIRAVSAMKNAGFSIAATSAGENPVYNVRYAKQADSLVVFSKLYNDALSPTSDFAAIMTCSHADKNCPVIPGASVRIGLTYDDPKQFDDTPIETMAYADRVNEIGREILFAFSNVKGKRVTQTN